MSTSKKAASELVSNRKARHHYEILETFEAGLALMGTEVKSLREAGGNLAEAYIRIKNKELWLIGAHIAPYRHGNIYNHEETRERKLLMHGYEIRRLHAQVKEKGITLIPLSLYLSKGKIKLKLATAKGKKLHDRRHAIKERDDKLRMDRAMRELR